MSRPAWLEHLFVNYTRGQLQAGFIYQRADKVPNSNLIEFRPHKLEGTKIPASTIAKFMSGQWQPKERSLKKFELFFRRSIHNRLRCAGANKTTSNYWPRRSMKFFSSPEGMDRIESLIEKYLNHARLISERKRTPIEYVLNGMMDSGMDESELDRYVDTVYM